MGNGLLVLYLLYFYHDSLDIINLVSPHIESWMKKGNGKLYRCLTICLKIILFKVNDRITAGIVQYQLMEIITRPPKQQQNIPSYIDILHFYFFIF